jgi:hypothetical protein
MTIIDPRPERDPGFNSVPPYGPGGKEDNAKPFSGINASDPPPELPAQLLYYHGLYFNKNGAPTLPSDGGIDDPLDTDPEDPGVEGRDFNDLFLADDSESDLDDPLIKEKPNEDTPEDIKGSSAGYSVSRRMQNSLLMMVMMVFMEIIQVQTEIQQSLALSSLADIDASFKLSEKAFEERKDAAEQRREASKWQAWGKMVSGGLNVIGGATGKQVTAGLFGGLGSIAEGFTSMQAASFTFNAEMGSARADLFQAAATREQAFQQRIDGSTQNTQQLIASFLQMMKSFIDMYNQCSGSIINNTGR